MIVSSSLDLFDIFWELRSRPFFLASFSVSAVFLLAMSLLIGVCPTRNRCCCSFLSTFFFSIPRVWIFARCTEPRVNICDALFLYLNWTQNRKFERILVWKTLIEIRSIWLRNQMIYILHGLHWLMWNVSDK